MQKNDFDTFFGKRRIVFGDLADKVVEFPYGLDAAEAGTGYHERQQFLANMHIGLHIGSFQHRDDVVAQVQSITQAFQRFAVLSNARHRGQIDGIAHSKNEVIIGQANFTPGNG